MKTVIFALATLLLTGCDHYQPVTTSDQVLAAQYRARTPHGAMTGIEAGIIADDYRKNIAAKPTPAPDTSQQTNGGQQ
jgi:hypothetical protein